MKRVAVLISFLIPVAHIHGQTQPEMNAQARTDFKQADAELNKTYQTVLAKFPTAEKQKLKEAQRAWITSRDAEAERAANEAEGGSMAPTLRYEKMAELSQERIKELKAMLDHGGESGPKPSLTPDSTNEKAQSLSKAKQTSSSSAVSPDKKWEYKPPTENEGPKIVKARTNDAAGDLSDVCDIGSCGDDASVLWAPDSKRFAFYWGQGRTRQTSFYQLRDDHWAPLDPQPGDEISERLQNDIATQLKHNGQSEEKLEKKGLYMRFILMVIKLDRWIDSNTVLLYAGEGEVVAQRDEPGEMSDGFAADFLFTLRFDDAGNWKIVKTHRLSDKEARERQKDL